MRRTRLSYISIATLVVALGAGAGFVSAKPLAQQTSRDQGVTIKVKPVDVAPTAAAWSFEIVLDTHGGELSDDLARTVTLHAGGKQTLPTAWQGDAPGGHHRKGTLRFEAIQPVPESIELRVQRPGEKAPRSFRWRLK